VLEDVGAGMMSVSDAERVYAVVIDSDTLVVDEAETARARVGRRRERLGGNEPGDAVAAPPGSQQVGDMLHVVDGRWWSNGADLGPVSSSYKSAAVVLETPVRDLGPEFNSSDHEMADRFVLREYVCPRTGFRIDAELVEADAASLHDITLCLPTENDAPAFPPAREETEMMDKKEAAVRDVFAIWDEGPHGARAAWEKHGAENLVWWNSARGQIDGLDACLARCDEMYEALGIHRIGVPVKRLTVDDVCVYTERVDELYRADGSLIVAVPVTGVIEFDGDKIVSWRDYADDWLMKMQQQEQAPAIG
jgi:limonene-1,2-epoxide hydrolase